LRSDCERQHEFATAAISDSAGSAGAAPGWRRLRLACEPISTPGAAASNQLLPRDDFLDVAQALAVRTQDVSGATASRLSSRSTAR